ncbi:alpha-L-fucosidase [bacterium]|nr:alpha-L-fucosidase [bacterium]
MRRALAMIFMVPVCMAMHPDAGSTEATTKADPLKARPEVVEEWKDMRFGMFIHWGPVTLTGKELSHSRRIPDEPRPGLQRASGNKGETPVEVYDNLYKQWKPDKFDAREWVKLAQEAGTRYIIFTAKHHDGFCLFDSQLTDYKSTGPESVWKVDYLKELADACHEAGLKLIVYYSQPDWHHPDFTGEHHERYIQYLHGQLREILTNYGRIDGIWFDGLGGSVERWDAKNMFAMMRSIQPDLIINNRSGLPGDFVTPEQMLGEFQNTFPWESCMTLGTSWSWKPDDTIRPLTECLQMLASCACGDGNLALNTGPMPDGRIEPRQAERYREIGAWLGKYGESIYGTRGGPFRPPLMTRIKGRAIQDSPWPETAWTGGSTHRDKGVYLHVFRWPAQVLTLPPIAHKVLSVTVLTGGQAEFTQDENGIQIRVPSPALDPIDTILRLDLDGPAKDIPVLPPAVIDSGSLASGKRATASSSYRDHTTADKAFDGDPGTHWVWDPKDQECWLAVDLGEPRTFDHAWIRERGHGSWIYEYELQMRDDENTPWQTFHHGTRLGPDCEIEFAPVTGRFVRLHLLKYNQSISPRISEFQIYGPDEDSK